MCTIRVMFDGGSLTLLSQVFRRALSDGWLIISGPLPSIGDDSVERLLEIVNLSRPLLVIRAQGTPSLEIEQWVLDLEALFEIPLNFLDLDVVDDQILMTRWQEAGFVIVVAGDDYLALDSLIQRIAANQSELTLDRDQILWFVGPAGVIIGEWAYNASMNQTLQGMGWLPGAIILNQPDGVVEIAPVQEILRNQSRSYALNLIGGATIALAPDGEVDLWGSPTPSIVLGKGWGEL